MGDFNQIHVAGIQRKVAKKPTRDAADFSTGVSAIDDFVDTCKRTDAARATNGINRNLRIIAATGRCYSEAKLMQIVGGISRTGLQRTEIRQNPGKSKRLQNHSILILAGGISAVRVVRSIQTVFSDKTTH